MKRKMLSVNRKHVLIAAAVTIALVALVLAVMGHYYSTPAFSVVPMNARAQTISTDEVQRILQGDFQIVRRVQQIPAAVQQGFTVVSHEPFRMVNPGQEMSTDMILPGVPNKRLVFAGLGRDTAVLVFEQGGFAGTVHATVFSYSLSGGTWAATLNDYNVNDIASLRTAVAKGHYKKWEPVR